ncbi:helix-turn-helix domain-containing protein [Lactobacillus delbrueckii]|uniref:helix-turn-helix domain-containing protein n=1 Tax=Lactobacillus delbrueckii TaxID=1584 RepID=UPI003992F12A
MSEISTRLTYLRERQGWTKTRVAQSLGMSLQKYANYEYGSREPDLETIAKIASLYDVSADYLLGRKAPEKHEIDLAKDPEVLLYNGHKVSAEDMEVIKAILERHED